MKISLVIPSAKGSKLEILDSIKNSNIIPIVVEGGNTSKNRNDGIEKARTELIGFTNAHSILSENWYDETIKFFKSHREIDILGGPQSTLKSEGNLGRATGYALESFFGGGIASRRYSLGKENLNADETMITSANLICRKKVFEKVLFDENVYPGEDPKFIVDAKKEGFRIAYSPRIVTYNRRRSNILALAKQIFNYGRMRPKIEGMKGLMKKPMFVFPSLFVVYLISLIFTGLIGAYWTIPLIIYVALAIVFSLYGGIKNKDYWTIIPLIAIFPVIHISYGLGMIKGVFK